jgi:hypothetical protein
MVINLVIAGIAGTLIPLARLMPIRRWRPQSL